MGYIGNDPELMAITTCTELLESLTIEQRLRVMAMLGARFGAQKDSTAPTISKFSQQDSPKIGKNNTAIELSDNYLDTEKDSSYPTFYTVYTNDITQSEAEILLLIAFYVSNFGDKNFTRNDLMSYYREQEIYTESRGANSANNINSLIRSKFLEAIAKGNFRITKSGKTKAQEIIKRDEKPKSSSKKQSVKSSNNSNTRSGKKNADMVTFLPNLNLYPDNEISLEDFYNQFIVENNYENNLIFVFYLKEKLGLETIGLAEISTCYKTLNLEIPNVNQSLKDTARRKTWIIASDKNNIMLHRNGENHLNKKIKRKDSDNDK